MNRSNQPGNPLVIVPAYNEAASIQTVIQHVQAAIPRADILVIDDGSRDNTAAVAAAAGAFVVRHPFNLCIGGTVQTGLKFALERDYDYIMRVDGDGQHNPEELHHLFAEMQRQRADAVFGSRFLGHADWHIPLSRRVGIKTFATLVRLITRRPASDTTSGFFCMNRRAAAALARHVPQDYPEVEGRIILHKAGLTVVEVPAHMRPRMGGVSSINAWRSLYYAAKVSVAVLISALKEIPHIAPLHALEDVPLAVPRVAEVQELES